MMRQITVSEKTFGLKVRVRVGGDEAAAQKAASVWTDTIMSNSDELGDATAWTFHNANRAFIWLARWPESRQHGNSMAMVHECVHVAMSFLRDHVGEDIRKAEETCCYLVQHLADEIQHKLNRRTSR